LIQNIEELDSSYNSSLKDHSPICLQLKDVKKKAYIWSAIKAESSTVSSPVVMSLQQLLYLG